jgi:hypothetical protein
MAQGHFSAEGDPDALRNQDDFVARYFGTRAGRR